MDIQTLNLKKVIQIGLLAGIVVLYAGIIGMIATMHEREVINDLFSLGQVILLITPFIASFYVASQLKTNGATVPVIIGGGVIVGILTALPTVIMLLMNSEEYQFLLNLFLLAVPIVLATYFAKGQHDIGANQNSVISTWLLTFVAAGVVTGSFALIFSVSGEIRDVFTNIDRDWIEVVTFDNRKELITGIFTLLFASSVSGLAGSILFALPKVPRKALLYGLSLTLLVGVFGETVRLVLQENLSRDVLGEIFQRDTLKQTPALVLFLLSTGFGLVWALLGDNVRSNFSNMSGDQRRKTNTIGSLLFIGLLLILPWVIGRTLSDVAVTIGLYVLMGLGLNIAIGLAGLLDLGYVTNYAVGAYILAVFTSIGPLGLFENGVFNFWMVIPIALLSAMFAGFIFAVPVLRMRGDYLAIATLGFGEIIGKLAISDWLKPIIGGAQGVQAIPKPFLLGLELKNPEQLYYIILVACLVTLFVSIRLNNSRTGRQWMAIREDEDVATAMGIDTARAKLLAFTLSAATGGVAGAIFAAKVGTVFPNSFVVLVSINVLSLIIVGGIASNPGIVLGAVVLIGMPELLREFSDFRFLLYGILLIVMMVNRPEGLIPSRVRSREIATEKAKAGAGD
jgi:branched-chain amino acid transport system permease protein